MYRVNQIGLSLIILLCAFIPSLSVHAQSAPEIRCSMSFTGVTTEYKTNELRVTWIVDEVPLEYDVLAIQITREGETVPESRTGNDWRKFWMNDGEAFLDVTNLQPGEIELNAMLLGAGDRPCKDSDKGIWLATKKAKWAPPKVHYTISNFSTEHEQGQISFDITLIEPVNNVNYTAWVEQEGNNLGAIEMMVINHNPERVKIPISAINLGKLKDELPVKFYVNAWYTDHLREEVVVEKEAKIFPAPRLGFFAKIGKVVLAVLNSQTAIAGIFVVCFMLIRGKGLSEG